MLLLLRYEEAGVKPVPSLRNLKEQLGHIVAAVRAIGGERAAAGVTETFDASPSALPQNADVAQVASTDMAVARPMVVDLVPGAILSREAAFEQLLRVADYFRRSEPQSIVGFALEQVVRWGRMPLPELLAEFVPDGDPRAKFRWLGINTADPGNGSSQT